MVVLVSDNQTEYTAFIANTADELSKHEVKGLAIVALIDGHYELTAYWNMDLRNKLQAESAIRFDTIDDFMFANSDRYFTEQE